ncbi:RES family NAD+ phosphorylase [Nocardioides sp.]|uniref:RES family NAD+ phosphorylase n=1 Tax=Nocardioides sp. TaxID=35761 RepID=UPI0026076588|nr:RES family NAD+ phosphorylase [Nocardioides sp.]
MSAPYPKRPSRPPVVLTRRAEDVIEVRPVLWRVHPTVGQHVLGWSTLRQWGPAVSARFDPHPMPTGQHPGLGVTYAATDLATSVAEVFQYDRVIDTVTGRPKATSWQPIRPLRLLDLTGEWALRNGASHSFASGPRATCRAWARAIAATWPDLDGVSSLSTLTGRPVVALWAPAADSFPASPDFSEHLDADSMVTVMFEIARRYPSYRVI